MVEIPFQKRSLIDWFYYLPKGVHIWFLGSHATVTMRMGRFYAFAAVMAAVTAVCTVLMIPMPLPLANINFGPLVIFVTSILFGPYIGLIAASMGSAIGVMYLTMIFGYPAVFILGIVVARGPEALLIGLLRRRGEVLSMVIGTIYEVLAFFLMDWFLFGFGPALLSLGTFADLVFIIPAVIVIRVFRRGYKMRYIDRSSV